MSDLLYAVRQRLGLSVLAEPNFETLSAIYAAWCRHVPFDNLRKLVALNQGREGDLPGIHAPDFFEAWLQHGTGGTCWPSSNALFTLIEACGFQARRIAGHMLDLDVANHGSVIVTVGDEEWLVDSSMLSNSPLPMRHHVSHQPPPFVEVEPIDGTFRFWLEFLPRPTPIPCRIRPGRVEHDHYLRSYEASRGFGPFNERIYARRNIPGGMQVVMGCRRYRKTDGPMEASEPLSSEALRLCLVEEMGYSNELCDQLEKCGAWARTLEPETGPPLTPPEAPTELPPSMR